LTTDLCGDNTHTDEAGTRWLAFFDTRRLAMKLSPDAIRGPHITSYGPEWIAVNGQQHTGNLLVDSHGGAEKWDCTGFSDLEIVHFDTILALRPELVLFGSGAKIQFPAPRLLQNLYAQRIGVEVMDTPAACRTFNFLAGEGRKVVAALLL